jgi:uncharacterized protein YhaN
MNRSEATKGQWANAERRAVRIAAIKKWASEFHADPVKHQRWRDAIRRGHAKPELRDQKRRWMAKLMANPEIRERRVAALRKAIANPDAQEKRRRTLKETLARPEVRERRLAQLREVESRPETRARKSRQMKELWRKLKGGRKPKTEVWREAAALHAAGWSWPRIAQKLNPKAFAATTPRKAGRAVQSGVERYLKAIKT